MSFFNGIKSQYIDDSGKTRILNYDGGISIAVSPIPPLDVREAPIDDVIQVSLEYALTFIAERNFQITEKCGYEEGDLMSGLWLQGNESISFGFIFINQTDEKSLESIRDIPYNSDVLDPILVGTKSEMDIMRSNAKIAEYLKQYSLIEYAHNPTTFGINNYSVKPQHEYNLPENLGSKLTRFSPYFYRGSRIAVHDIDTRDRLMMYAKVTAYNDSTMIQRYKLKAVIDGPLFYKSVKDFRVQPNQFVFATQLDVLRWKNEIFNNIANYTVNSIPLPDSKYPYYYRNLKIMGGRLMIIQNTREGTFPAALAVSKKWELQHINPGYDPKDITLPEKEILAFEVFTEDGLTHKSGTSTENNPLLKIFAYIHGESQYGAVLFL